VRSAVRQRTEHAACFICGAACSFRLHALHALCLLTLLAASSAGELKPRDAEAAAGRTAAADATDDRRDTDETVRASMVVRKSDAKERVRRCRDRDREQQATERPAASGTGHAERNGEPPKAHATGPRSLRAPLFRHAFRSLSFPFCL
jgi:hypothetical protein